MTETDTASEHPLVDRSTFVRHGPWACDSCGADSPAPYRCTACGHESVSGKSTAGRQDTTLGGA